MTVLPDALFVNPVFTALESNHRHFAITSGGALRYPAAVTPFAAIRSPTTVALSDLCSLLVPEESVWVAALGKASPADAGLVVLSAIDVLQMVLPPEIELPAPDPEVRSLDGSHAAEMVALTDIAFPGFFRRRTCEMGAYFGIYSDRQLVSMGGERLRFPGYSELSGICTHPAHRGQGHAARMLLHLARLERSRGIVPWLHVTATNRNAVDLYLRLGFETVRLIKLSQLARR
jgi:ribosomal protein S18 acetylase RimI-like enzyme